ncbi:C40 family peptidase [Virgibacillus natechei]|nr:C40 family peptidase [Virgibacillus natechei]UZD14934.1 NlpC/P60 family protein [Virgibacillus natechei]
MVVGMTTVAVVGISSAFFGISAHANTVDELEDRQTEIESERLDIKADLSEAESEIADILFELEELNEEMNRVDDALEHNTTKMDETEESIEKSEEKVTSLEEEIDTLEETIEQRFAILEERIVSYQKNGGNINYLEVIFGSQNFGDFVNRVSAINKITDSDASLIEQQEEDKQKVKAKQDEVLDKLEELENMKADLDEILVLIEDQQQQNEESEEKLLARQDDLTTLKEELEIEDSDLAALEGEVSESITAANRPEPSSSQNVAQSSEPELDDEVEGNLTTLSSEESNSNNDSSNSSNNNNNDNNNSGSGMSTVINAGFDHIGVPYTWGGKTPSGFDCSGFVSWAFAQGGYSIPSTTGALAGTGSKVSYSNAQPGDLVFFDTTGGPGTNGHVGIYLGGGQFIGAQNSTGLDVADMTSGYWKDNFNGHVRRVN